MRVEPDSEAAHLQAQSRRMVKLGRRIALLGVVASSVSLTAYALAGFWVGTAVVAGFFGVNAVLWRFWDNRS